VLEKIGLAHPATSAQLCARSPTYADTPIRFPPIPDFNEPQPDMVLFKTDAGTRVASCFSSRGSIWSSKFQTRHSITILEESSSLMKTRGFRNIGSWMSRRGRPGISIHRGKVRGVPVHRRVGRRSSVSGCDGPPEGPFLVPGKFSKVLVSRSPSAPECNLPRIVLRI
jgi:hypothetical protein